MPSEHKPPEYKLPKSAYEPQSQGLYSGFYGIKNNLAKETRNTASPAVQKYVPFPVSSCRMLCLLSVKQKLRLIANVWKRKWRASKIILTKIN